MKEKPEQTAKRLAKTRGYSYPEWEYLAEKDAEFLDAYNRLSGLSLLHEGVSTEGKQLPAKYRELIAIAAMIGAPACDQLLLTRLKKRKLFLKDLISQLEDSLLPDITA